MGNLFKVNSENITNFQNQLNYKTNHSLFKSMKLYISFLNKKMLKK